jgi:hypothetical protein
MMALRQWGDRWVIGVERAPVIVVERESSQPIAELCVTSRDGRPLRPSDVRMIPGPGAAAATKERLAHGLATPSDESESTRREGLGTYT